MTPNRSPLKAIRAKCIDCCCGNKAEVRLCPSEKCPLWPFRSGHRLPKEIVEGNGGGEKNASIASVGHLLEYFLEYILFLHEVFKGCGMGNQLDAVIQRTIVLAVGEAELFVHVIGIPVGVITVIAVIFHFQLKAEVNQIGGSVFLLLFFSHAEAGIGLVGVAAYTDGRRPVADIAAFLPFGCAVFAGAVRDEYDAAVEVAFAFIAVIGVVFYAAIAPELGVVIAGVYAVGIIHAVDIAAVCTAEITALIVEAAVTDISTVDVVRFSDGLAFTAVIADEGNFIEMLGAVVGTFELDLGAGSDDCAAVCTGDGVLVVAFEDGSGDLLGVIGVHGTFPFCQYGGQI